MNLESLINNLITSGIKASTPEMIRRIKVLNIFQLVFIMLAPLLGLFYFYIGAILLFYVSIIAGLTMISSVIFLRKTQNITLAGNYAIFILWVTLFILSWSTGAITYEGVIKPSWILNGGLILLAIFLNGYLGATIWTSMVFIETGLVIYLFRTGFQFPNLIPPEISAVYSLGSYLVSLLAILTCAFLFETEKKEALTRVKGQSRVIRDSRRYIDDLLNRSPTPTFLLDLSHRVIQWNQACYDLTGIKAEEILGNSVWEGVKFDDDQGSMADIFLDDPESIKEKFADSIISQTESGWFEMEMSFPKLKGGIKAVVSVGPVLDNDGAVRGAIQTIQERGARRATDGGMMGGFVGEVAESSVNPVFRIDSRGKICSWNRACEKTFGYSPEQMLDKNALTLVAKQYRHLFRESIVRVFKGESLAGEEWKYYGSNGEPVYVMAQAYSVMEAEGKGKECVIENTNITNLKMKLKKFKLYASETREKLKTLSGEHDLLKKNIATFIRKKEDK